MAGDGKSTMLMKATAVAMTSTTTNTTATSSTATPSSSSSSSTRRTTRYVTSSLRSSTTRSFHVERPPIILQIGSTIWRVGYADQVQPQHIIKIDTPIWDDQDDPNIPSTTPTSTSTSTTTTMTKTESEWYLVLSPVIEQVYDRLMCKPSTRRVVCLYPHPYISLSFQRALEQHLWNLNVPSMVQYDTLQLGPMIPLGLKRALIVQISNHDMICVCHADGYVLPYTYQMIPIGYTDLMIKTSVGSRTGDSGSDTKSSTSSSYYYYCAFPSPDVAEAKMNDLLLDEKDPHSSLVLAILSCLQQCPVDLRSSIVSNILFCGDGVVLFPDLPRLVVHRIQQLLTEGPSESSLLSQQNRDDDVTRNEVTTTRIPIQFNKLKPLASKVTLTSCGPYRPDWIAWIGASLWASTWNKYDDDETPIQWKVNTNSSTTTTSTATGITGAK